jgi:hypothetical protein
MTEERRQDLWGREEERCEARREEAVHMVLFLRGRTKISGMAEYLVPGQCNILECSIPQEWLELAECQLLAGMISEAYL